MAVFVVFAVKYTYFKPQNILIEAKNILMISYTYEAKICRTTPVESTEYSPDAGVRFLGSCLHMEHVVSSIVLILIVDPAAVFYLSSSNAKFLL